MKARIRFFLAVFWILIWLLVNLVFYQFTIIPGFGWRYLLIPPIVFFFVLWLGVRYINQVYDLKNMPQALIYLLACLFGLRYPTLSIGDGKALVDDHEENLVLKIGGPASLIIQPGNVALIENYSGTVRVFGPGTHLITRLETIKEVVSLDERYRPVEKLTARSKDGIEVNAKDIRYRYRIASERTQGENSQPAAAKLFEYSEDAVIRMVYNRVQSSSGLVKWEDGVNSIVETIITDFIRQHHVDYLTAPRVQGIDPRAEIYAQFNSESGKKKFLDLGAELIWIDIGHFETTEKSVAMQRVSTWQARWAENPLTLQDFSNVAEIGKAEAGRDLIIRVAQCLDQVIQLGEPREKIRTLVLARISQLLDD